MNIDFLHNQIIRDTITPKFIESFNDNLVPYLMSEYGSSLEQIQFYEDHLASGLRIGGEFYYPLTVVVSGKPIVRCVSWQVSNYRNYDKFNPFSYKGREPLEFNLLDEIPDAVKAAIKGKSIYFNTGSAVPVSVTFTGDDKTFLAGKYSQGFIDIMAKSLTEIIEREFNISGLASSGVVIEISYAPGTFMEHIVGNTTYRRALLLARGCAARDLWIKWTRLDGFGTYTVSDTYRFTLCGTQVFALRCHTVCHLPPTPGEGYAVLITNIGEYGLSSGEFNSHSKQRQGAEPQLRRGGRFRRLPVR